MTVPHLAADTSPLERLFNRFTHVERREVEALALSFAYFFFVLAAYYIIRPIRDEMGVKVGTSGLEKNLFLVFFVMLAAVPLFGWVVSTYRRHQIIPFVYAFFIAQLIIFAGLLTTFGQTPALATGFFVWASVFNLFVISLFWSLMSEIWRSEQAKRLYGVIAGGGSIGGLVGPLVTKLLVGVIGPNMLLLVSAGFLAVAVLIAMRLHAIIGNDTSARSVISEPATPAPPEGGVLAGALQVWRSPYLFRIALCIFLANLLSTFFYFEQARIVGAAFADCNAQELAAAAADCGKRHDANRASRVQLFASMDFTVSLLTILVQFFATAWVMRRFGAGLTAALLPATAAASFVALAVAPVLAVIVVIVVTERVTAFALSNPALKVFYTHVAPEEKYRAQNFIDTVVFRGGDAASGSLFNVLAKSLGLSATAIAGLTIPFALGWFGLTLALGRRQAEVETKAAQTQTS